MWLPNQRATTRGRPYDGAQGRPYDTLDLLFLLQRGPRKFRFQEKTASRDDFFANL
jgi:hypothetical protein